MANETVLIVDDAPMNLKLTGILLLKEGYKVLSEKSGKNLGGPYKTKAEAKKRLQQVEYFKRTKG